MPFVRISPPAFLRSSGQAEGGRYKLQLSVFGVIWVREARTGVGVIGRRVGVGLGATGCPPAGGVLLQLAHLGAASMGVGFGAGAVANRV